MEVKRGLPPAARAHVLSDLRARLRDESCARRVAGNPADANPLLEVRHPDDVDSPPSPTSSTGSASCHRAWLEDWRAGALARYFTNDFRYLHRDDPAHFP